MPLALRSSALPRTAAWPLRPADAHYCAREAATRQKPQAQNIAIAAALDAVRRRRRSELVAATRKSTCGLFNLLPGRRFGYRKRAMESAGSDGSAEAAPATEKQSSPVTASAVSVPIRGRSRLKPLQAMPQATHIQPPQSGVLRSRPFLRDGIPKRQEHQPLHRQEARIPHAWTVPTIQYHRLPHTNGQAETHRYQAQTFVRRATISAIYAGSVCS